MAHVAVTAVGVDRPGIVAALTGALVAHGGNLEDTSMTILRGHFAMMLVVAVPDGLAPEELEQALTAATSHLDLVVSVRAIAEQVSDAAVAGGEEWTVSVHGADRPGIVHGVATVLAALGVNITDLTTHALPGGAYVMVLGVAVPPSVERPVLASRLEAAAADLGVECHLHPADADLL